MLNLERKIWIVIGTRPELIKQLPVYNECVNSMKSATSPARKKNMTLSNCLKQSKSSQTVYSGSNTAAFNKFIIFNPVGAAYVLIRDVVTKEVTKY